jgi:Fe-S-cluster containining protein
VNKDKVAALEAIYASLPKISCKGLCDHSCGPIGFTEIEAKRIEKKVHRLPTLVEGELRCSLLVGGRCEAYAVRPLVCRLYGVAEHMMCPHGCTPSRYLTKEQAQNLLRKVEAISPLTAASQELVRLAWELDI